MKLGWCVSGQGMVMRAVVLAQRAGLLETRIVLVVTDRASPIESFCAENGIAHVRSDPSELSSCLIEGKSRHGLDWLALTFNRLLKPDVIAAYEQRILNLHFSLLPDFPGFGPTAKALAGGADMAGVSVHLIDAGIDTGPIVAQAECPILPDDTVATLGRRQFECAVPLVLQTVRGVEQKKLTVVGGYPVSELAMAGGARGTALSIDRDLAAFAAGYCADLGT